MRKQAIQVTFLAILLLSINGSVFGLTTDAELTINYDVSRNLGMGLGPFIQGTFTIQVSGPDDLVRVEFYLDDVLMKNDTTDPFSWKFDTSSFGSGEHEFKITGYNANNQGTVMYSKTVVSLWATIFLVVIIISLAVAIKYVIFPALMKRRSK